MKTGDTLLTDDPRFIQQIEDLLADPSHQDNPLRGPLAALLEQNRNQQERMERLVRISDGYHSLSRNEVGTLSQRYDRQLRRIEKLSRISDRYQESMRQLNISLREAALHDPLTGMGNRRYLMDRLREEVERVLRNNHSFSLAILDIDHFKQVNDTFGHETGDQLLCELAHVIPATLREYDICGRWGGEEFLIIFPHTSIDDSREVSERIRSTIHQVTLPSIVEAHPISASFGLTEYHHGEGYSETIKRADDALYRAKELGRNRVEVG